MITISLPDDVARLVYDEIQGRMELLDYSETIEDREARSGAADIHNRVYRALEATLNALDAAGSGPSPYGTYLK
jgi:hypothetical protein